VKIIPQIDTYPRLLAFGQTRWGKLTLLVAFASVLWVDRVPHWLALTAAAGVMSYLPKYRESLLTLAGLCFLFLYRDWVQWGFLQRIAAGEAYSRPWILDLSAVVLLSAIICGFGAFFHYVRRRRGSSLARHPVLALVSGYLLLLLAAGILQPRGAARTLLWVFVALLGPILWYLAYALQDAGSKSGEPYTVELGTVRSFFMTASPTFTPIGKGRAYLRKTEARTPEDLSRVQLKAVKLLLWVTLLKIARQLFVVIVYGEPFRPAAILFTHLGKSVPNLAVPTLAAALEQTVAGTHVPAHLAWASVTAQFLLRLLEAAIYGNQAVACCRMAGFCILRNTYRPLQSQTIAEFWNRYQYYFKELLVEIFFFPTYLRYFKKYRRLRTFAATIAAATLGNMIYHFCRDFHYVAEMGLGAALSGFQVYAFYTLVLGIGIGLSQMRSRRADPPREVSFGRHFLASAVVFAFFCLLEIFDYEPRSHTLGTHLAFFLNLFSLHT
jgi:hypothetical protein